jgi:hypothetical protein
MKHIKLYENWVNEAQDPAEKIDLLAIGAAEAFSRLDKGEVIITYDKDVWTPREIKDAALLRDKEQLGFLTDELSQIGLKLDPKGGHEAYDDEYVIIWKVKKK